MSASELEQAQLVQSERRMWIMIAAKQRKALKARIMIMSESEENVSLLTFEERRNYRVMKSRENECK
jgi:hypothetical protein